MGECSHRGQLGVCGKKIISDKLIQNGSTPYAAITNGFRKIICRIPEKKETDILVNYWKERQSYFKANTKEADKIVKIGEYKPKVKSNADLAAMMQVMQVIYNMEEAITKT